MIFTHRSAGNHRLAGVFLSVVALATVFTLVKPFSFLKPPVDCEKIHRDILKTRDLSQRDMAEFEIKAEHCMETGRIQSGILILESLLRKSEKNNSPIKEIKRQEKKLADRAFYKAQNYEKALKYHTRLLKRTLSQEEKLMVQLHIAESFFYLKKHSQALRELEKCFTEDMSMEQRKQAWILKARILIAEKKFSPAIQLFEKQIESFPKEEAFFREYLALIHESKKDFLSAQRELEKIQPSSPFIEQKIQRLMERQINQPGF